MEQDTGAACPSVCPCAERCPIGDALRMIGGKWKLRILCVLTVDGKQRYGDLQKKIPGITPAMLTSSLRDMEADGLVLRTQYPQMPVRVDYSLTERAAALWPILHRLAHWGSGVPFDSDDEPVGRAPVPVPAGPAHSDPCISK